MKKLTLCMLATFLMLSVISTQLKAATESNPATGTSISDIQLAESNVDANRLTEIKSIEISTLNSTVNNELLDEVSSVQNDQGRHRRGYERRNRTRDVDVTITSRHQRRGDGYHSGRHNHSGAYVGGGGVLVLILILILVL